MFRFDSLSKTKKLSYHQKPQKDIFITRAFSEIDSGN